jgi:hypothetical protein
MNTTNTIAKQVADRLRQHIDRGEGVVSVDAGDVTVSVDVEQSERYAVGVRGIHVKPLQPGGNIRDTADRIVEQVQSLDEPLTVIECDSAAGRAIVRSAEPEADERGVTYWEADVQADGTSLHRYHKDHTATDREVVTEPMKHGTAGRVAEQLADAVRSAQTTD